MSGKEDKNVKREYRLEAPKRGRTCYMKETIKRTGTEGGREKKEALRTNERWKAECEINDTNPKIENETPQEKEGW